MQPQALREAIQAPPQPRSLPPVPGFRARKATAGRCLVPPSCSAPHAVSCRRQQKRQQKAMGQCSSSPALPDGLGITAMCVGYGK